MRDLMYALADGSVVTTMGLAKESGLDYKVFLNETESPDTKQLPLKPKQLAKRISLKGVR